MTGKQLFDKFKQHLNELGTECDSWEDMEHVDREAWEALAVDIAEGKLE